MYNLCNVFAYRFSYYLYILCFTCISFSMCIFTFTDDGNIWVPLLLKKAWTRSSFHWALARCKGSCKKLQHHTFYIWKGWICVRVYRSHRDSHLIEKQHPASLSLSPPKRWGAIYHWHAKVTAFCAELCCVGGCRWLWRLSFRICFKWTMSVPQVEKCMEGSDFERQRSTFPEKIAVDFMWHGKKRCTSHDIGMLGGSI